MNPGWYKDPSNPKGLRWWDGTQWTSAAKAPQGKGAAITAVILTAIGVLIAFIPGSILFVWIPMIAAGICAIVALAKRQKFKALSIICLCLVPVTIIGALVASLVQFAGDYDGTAEPLTVGPVDESNYPAADERTLALVAKDADDHVGGRMAVYGRITQFDKATGDCSFRAEIGHEQTDSMWGYDHNSYFTAGAATCDDLDEYVEEDHVKILATVHGVETYSTMIGGNTSVPRFQVDQIEVLD